MDRSREEELVLEVSRRAPRIPLLVGLDLGRALKIAEAHGVDGLLSRALASAGVDEVIRFRSLLLRDVNTKRLAEGVEVSEVLSRRGLRHAWIKGPLIAQEHYGDLGLRRFGDLDLLVAMRDLDAVEEVLRARGFTRSNEGDPADVARVLERVSASPCVIELHSTMSRNAFACGLETEELLSRVRLLETLGHRVPVPSKEDNFLLLAHHGAKHAFERLIWIVDLDRVLASPGFELPQMFAHARERGLLRIAELAVEVVAATLGRAEVAGSFRPDPILRVVSARIAREIFSAGFERTARTQVVRSLVRDSVRDALSDARGFVVDVMRPGPRDTELVPSGFPRILAWGIRPIRLAAREARRRTG